MDVKHIHETIEKLAEFMYTEACGDLRSVDTKEFGELVDMVSDLAEAEYHARISCEMKKAEEEEEQEAKYMMKQMKEQYGEEDGERMYRMGYNRNRYSNGRFAPRGRGRRMGYMPSEMRMPYLEDEYMAEYLGYPDYMDDVKMRMGYNSGGRGGNSGMGMRGGDMNNGNMGGNDGNQGNQGNQGRSGYGDGRGESEGSRYGRSYNNYRTARRHYTNTKDPDEQKKMKESIAEVFDDMEEITVDMVRDMTPEEKQRYKKKLQDMMQKIQ